MCLRFTAILPMDPPEESAPEAPQIVHPLPSDEVIAQLQALVENYWQTMSQINAYVYDLKVEAQNNLLSDLFAHRVSPRVPLDPRYKVISTQVRQLMNWSITSSPRLLGAEVMRQ